MKNNWDTKLYVMADIHKQRAKVYEKAVDIMIQSI